MAGCGGTGREAVKARLQTSTYTDTMLKTKHRMQLHDLRPDTTEPTP